MKITKELIEVLKNISIFNNQLYYEPTKVIKIKDKEVALQKAEAEEEDWGE